MSMICEVISGPLMTDISFLVRAVQAELAVPAQYYPCFADWLYKVVLELTAGMRSLVLARSHGRIVGINILKHHEMEKKLCTFWVNPEFRHQHIASTLLNESLRCFGGAAPVISIPQCTLDAFHPLIEQRRFGFLYAKPNLYRRGQKEYFFKIPNPQTEFQEPQIVKASDMYSSAVPSGRFSGAWRRARG